MRHNALSLLIIPLLALFLGACGEQVNMAGGNPDQGGMTLSIRKSSQTDPLASWSSESTTGIPTDVTLKNLAYGNGVFIATGSTIGSTTVGRIFRSTDGGKNWSYITPPITNIADIDFVKYGNGLFVATARMSGGALAILYSQDGSTWEAATHPSVTFSRPTIAFATGVFVAVNGGKILRSENGQSWTDVTPATPTYLLRDLIHDGSRFVALGLKMTSSPVILTSENGSSWTEQDITIPGTTPFSPVAISFGKGRYILSIHQSPPTFYRSSDLQSWDRQFIISAADDPGYDFQPPAFRKDYFLTSGTRLSDNKRFFFASADGSNWVQKAEIPAGDYSAGIDYGGRRMVTLRKDAGLFYVHRSCYLETPLVPSVSSLAFGKVALDAPAPEQVLTITNDTFDPLSITSISTSGTHASEFTVIPGTGACSTTTPVSPAHQCSITVKFTPTSPGPKSAFLEVVY